MVERFFHTFFNQIQTKAVWIVVLMIPFVSGILWLVKKRRTKFKDLNWKSIAFSAVLGIFLAALFSLTLLSREAGSIEKSFEWRPLWSYQEAILEGNRDLGIEIVSNILLFIPFGFLMAVFFRGYEQVKWTAKVAAVLSLMIELIQGIFSMGLFEFDDILNNVLGAVIGVGMWRLQKWWRKKGAGGR